MELKKVKIIRLPTKEKSNIILDNREIFFIKTNKIYYRNHNDFIKEGNLPENMSYCHLYFITNEKIKKGDWYYDLVSKSYRVALSNIDKSSTFYPNIKKIIATTNSNLNIEVVGTWDEKLPQPSQAFIEKYCKLDGIDEIDVEYERKQDQFEFDPSYLELKTDSHNIITIHSIKTSWNKEDIELIKAFEEFACAVITENYSKNTSFKKRAEIMSKDWIKNNL